MDQEPRPSAIRQPRRPLVTAGIIAATVVALSGLGVGAYAISNTLSADTVVEETSSEAAAPPILNVAPAASFSFLTVDGLTITVDGSNSSDPEGEIVEYAWDFGDGGTASGARTSHSYSDYGTYTVTLNVIDDAGGSSSFSASVTLNAPPPPPAPPAPPAGGAPGSLVPFYPSSDPNNANGGDYADPGIYCQSGSASGNPPVCD